MSPQIWAGDYLLLQSKQIWKLAMISPIQMSLILFLILA